MKRRIPGRRIGIILGLLLFYFSGCLKQGQKESGYLKGIISIGPLCPVETIPPDPGCLPTAETYKEYPVSVYTSDGKKKISALNPSLDGKFTCELSPGNYLVELEKSLNNIGSSNLPEEISIISGDTTGFTVTIDTGIR